MSELAIRLILLLLWAAVVSLDERAFGSYVFHQPLVAGSIAGALLGHVEGGMYAGLVFQCLWPGLMPVGGDLLPSVGLAAVLAGAVSGWGGHLMGTRVLRTLDGPLFFGVVLGLLAAWAGRSWEAATRRRNAGREEEALRSSAPLEQALARALRASYLDTAGRGVVIVGSGLFLAGLVYLWPAAVRAVGRAPFNHLGSSLRPAALALGLGGLAASLQCFRRPYRRELLWGLAAGVAIQLLREL